MSNDTTFVTISKNNPYLSVIYTDGELLQLKKRLILCREDLIKTAEAKETPLIPLYLSHIRKVSYEITLITNALECN